MGKPSTRATNRWIAKAYDRINLTVAKGRKEEIQSFAESCGESVNGFINRAIDEAMRRGVHAPGGYEHTTPGASDGAE